MYILVKLITRFSMWIFCKRLGFYNREVERIKTPMILGCNHPNSFLDAMIIGALMDQRVHFITRSDVFKKAWIRALLRSVNMIPIYRIRDGKHNMSKNDATFEETRKILMKGEDVLIFVEGFCSASHILQLPLKKGAPRMLMQAWDDGLDVKLVPVWIRYSSLSAFPKEVDIHYGKPFGKEIVNMNEEAGIKMLAINKETETQLKFLSEVQNSKPKAINKTLLFIPAMLGFISHVLYYILLQKIAFKLKGTIHYDSILFCLLGFLYPFYLLLIGILLNYFVGFWWALAAIFLMPLFAKAYTLWK